MCFIIRTWRSGEIAAYVRDPETGDVLRLSPGSWLRVLLFLEQMDDDTDRDSLPHNSECVVRDKIQPIFLWQQEFECWLQKTFGTSSRKRPGRKLGTGSFEHIDEPFLQEMRLLIEKGSAKSAEDAAGKVAGRAPGASFESIRTRLANRYRKQYRSE
jgi:hypothetical protein